MAPTSAETKARILLAVHSSSAKVAPLTTMASPSAMMTNSEQRSAMCAPSTAQASTEEKPSFGTQKRTAGEMYSQLTAAIHSHSRVSPSDRPPAIHKTAETESQVRMRIALCRTAVW